jgi:glycosyltransferase involved in cell wall biosynthesis
MRRALRVAINAQIPGDGSSGGIQQALVALLRSLSAAPSDDAVYLVLSGRRDTDWLQEAAGESTLLCPRPLTVVEPAPQPRDRISPRRLAVTARSLGLRTLGRLRSEALPASPAEWMKALGADLVHFPYQRLFPTAVPYVINPWDLQHLHLPEMLDEGVVRQRTAGYESACIGAAAVVVGTPWVRNDVTARMGVLPKRVHAVPLAAPAPFTIPTADIRRVHARLGVREPFLLYPAHTFPHKNHLQLLECLARLRHRGIRAQCLCPGGRSPFAAVIEEAVLRLGLEAEVSFPGFVGESELRALYASCRMVVFPSLFEGFGLPLLESFAGSAPVACSDLPPLREVAADAALYFDPRDPDVMADTLAEGLCSEPLRRRLIDRGRLRLGFFAPRQVGAAMRAVYRLALEEVALPADAAALDAFQSGPWTS